MIFVQANGDIKVIRFGDLLGPLAEVGRKGFKLARTRKFGIRAHQVERCGDKWQVWMVERKRQLLLSDDCGSEQEAERVVRNLIRLQRRKRARAACSQSGRKATR